VMKLIFQLKSTLLENLKLCPKIRISEKNYKIISTKN